MYQRCESSFALAIAVALALCASEAWAAAPIHAMAESPLGNVSVPPPGLLHNGAPVATANFGGGDVSLAVSHTWVNVATLCTSTAFAPAPPSAKKDLCLDNRSVSPRDLLNILPPISARAPDGDSLWLTTSPTWTSAIMSFAPAGSTGASSRGIPYLRPDNSPVPPIYLLNIWAPVSASAPGGSGTWSLTSATWTNINGDAPAAMSPQPGFARFQGIPGLVTVDDSAGAVGVTGMHFAVDGYTLTGDALQLAGGAGSLAKIDVGDGTSAGAGDRAVISNALTGSAGLNKIDFGTLVLAGDNTYSGGTTISSGTLQIGNGGSTGSIVGNVTNNGVLFFDRSDAVTFSGVVSGTGALGQFAASMLTLTGANTYTGETDISNGTLALSGNGSIASSFVVAVFNGGTLDISGTASGTKIKNLTGDGGTIVLGGQTLTVDEDADMEFGGAIGGMGGLVLSDGILTLAGKNTYTGGTTVDSGAVFRIGDGGPSASIAGNILNNGRVEFWVGNDLTYGGLISGTGNVSVDAGVGTLALTGLNTFSGGISIDGSLSVAQDANLGAASNSLEMGDGTLETTASFSTGRNMVLGGLNSAIRTDPGSDLTMTGAISGEGMLTKEGDGTLVLTGTSTWSGGVEVAGGMLELDGSVTLVSNPFTPSDVSVDGGTLTGTGTVNADVSNSAKVAVHGGDLMVGGSYSQNFLSTLAVSLGSKLAVTGTATLNGGTLEVTGADSGYVANTHTDVLTATGGVIGTFDQLVKNPGVVFTSTTIGYGPNDVYLDTTGLNITVAAKAMGIADAPSMAAAQRVQDGFETINATMASCGAPSSDVLQGAGAIQHSATPAVAQATLTSLSGQLHAASAAMLFDGIDARSNALSEHFDDLVGGRTKSGVWYSDLGWQGNLQRGGYAGATFRSDGGMAGADVRIGRHALLGFAVGQSNGVGQLDAAWDHNRTWMNSVAMYGGLVNGPWYANAQIAGGWYREDMQRLLQLGALGSPVGAGSNGGYVGGSLEGGRLFNIGSTRVVPFADVRYQRLDLGGFTEQGGLGYGLTADARTAGRLQAGLGVRTEHGWRLANGMRMEFDGSADWQHALHQYGSVFDASFTGFNDWMPVEGIGLSKDTVILRTGLSLWPTRNFGLRFGYLREQDQRERAGSAMLQGTVTF